MKCDGAALYYGGKCWLVGVSPTLSQIKEIAESLVDAGYSGASILGDAICGMATARITSKDFLFWFRGHSVKEVKWGGAMHNPMDKDDDDGSMNPRSSFSAFLEEVRNRSLPWEISEINAIQSMQLIMRDTFQEIEDRGTKAIIAAHNNNSEERLDELSSVAGEMVRLIETASGPIFGVDSAGFINGWNAKIAELTRLQASEAMGKSLLDEIVHEDSCGVAENLICRALQGDSFLMLVTKNTPYL